MPSGLATTWQVLTKTRNGAVTEILTPLLHSGDQELVERCVKTLVRRRDTAGHKAVIAEFHRLGAASLDSLSELPGRMTSAFQEALTGHDQHLFKNAVAAIKHLREYDLFPALVAIAEKKGGEADAAASTLLALAEQLHAEIGGERPPADRRDPERYRSAALSTLQESMSRFSDHGRREIMDALLLLAPLNSKTISQILEGSSNPCQQALLEELATSANPRVISQLVAMALRPGAARDVVQLLGRRCDLPFVQHLLSDLDPQRLEPLRRSLKQLEQIDWIAPERGVLPQLEGAEEEAAVSLVRASGIRRVQAFDFLGNLMERGKPEGRRAACAGLVDFQGEAANNLVVRALDDESPGVQAEAVKQLRERAIPGGLACLVRLLDSPHSVVRDAARGSLSEFSFERYRAAFDYLADATRTTAGKIVRKVDLSLPESLRRELTSLARTRRLRAIEMSYASGAVEFVERELIENLRDEDHFIRSAAARALGRSTTTAGRAALISVLGDRSIAVQEAAKEGLSGCATG